MLIMPNSNVPNAVWELAETEEMKEVVGLYGKTYHFWQVDRGDALPLGKPELMMSFTKDEQVRQRSFRNMDTVETLTLLQVPWDKIKDRDERYGVETGRKKGARKDIVAAEIHGDADQCWKKR